MRLVFIDPKCPKPYDSEVLATRGLGGTEATVVRVARALSDEHAVTVLQHNRTEPTAESARLRFAPISERSTAVAHADHVVFIQKAQDLSAVAGQTQGKLWLWLHNYLHDEVPFFWQDHLRFCLGIICVSRTHAEHTRRYLRSRALHWATLGLAERGGILFHHNPIDDALTPDPKVLRQPHKLVFFSSPYKGIEHVLARFREAHEADPRWQLFVADPGYIRNFDHTQLEHPGIVRLGSLPQREVLRHVREALCVFYPQYKRAETFGLVYAEANAVGTPVLAHDFGAAREVLSPDNPPLDAREPSRVLACLKDWANGGAPALVPDARFKLSRIAAGWERFFAEPVAYTRKLEVQSA